MASSWVKVFRHMPEVQVFCDKFHHVLLLDYIGNCLNLKFSGFSKLSACTHASSLCVCCRLALHDLLVAMVPFLDTPHLAAIFHLATQNLQVPNCNQSAFSIVIHVCHQ